MFGFDHERGLAEEVIEGFREFVVADLEDALIDGEDDDASWAIGFVADVEGLTWEALFGGEKSDGEPAFFEIGFEGDGGVAERGHEDFFGVEGANEADIDVAGAFEVCGDADALDRAGAIGFEPRVGVDLVAFDGDQAASCVGGDDTDFDLFAWFE